MPNYQQVRDIDGARMKCFKLVLGAMASCGVSYGFLMFQAWGGAIVMVGVAGILIHIARTMPLKEKLIVSGAAYRTIPRTW